MYRTNFGIGHSIKDLLEAHIPPGGRLGRGVFVFPVQQVSSSTLSTVFDINIPEAEIRY
jgi:hypothetical protein